MSGPKDGMDRKTVFTLNAPANNKCIKLRRRIRSVSTGIYDPTVGRDIRWRSGGIVVSKLSTQVVNLILTSKDVPPYPSGQISNICPSVKSAIASYCDNPQRMHRTHV
eukprot:1195056-Prorocentrum_minimum.AAC.1